MLGTISTPEKRSLVGHFCPRRNSYHSCSPFSSVEILIFNILLNTAKIKRIGIKAGMTRCWIIVVFKWSEGLVCSFQAYHQFCVVHIEHTIHAPLLGRKKLCCLICRSSGGTASEHLIHIFQNLALLLYPADVH